MRAADACPALRPELEVSPLQICLIIIVIIAIFNITLTCLFIIIIMICIIIVLIRRFSLERVTLVDHFLSSSAEVPEPKLRMTLHLQRSSQILMTMTHCTTVSFTQHGPKISSSDRSWHFKKVLFKKELPPVKIFWRHGPSRQTASSRSEKFSSL